MTQQVDDGGPAFPVAEDHRVADSIPWTSGMSLRDYFAAAASQGLLAQTDRAISAAEIARQSFVMADAMLKSRQGAKQ